MTKKVLLDTNIIIHRETPSFWVDPNIGNLFGRIDKCWYEKWIHPITISEIEWHEDKKIVELMKNKLNSYQVLKSLSDDTPEIINMKNNDKDINSINDTNILKEVYTWTVDYLITEDKQIHDKANILWISDRVYNINSFLGKLIDEYPGLNDYKTLSIKKAIIWNLNINDPFFDSLRNDYPEFNERFKKKSQEEAYVYFWKEFDIQWFLYLKHENKDESYYDIDPIFPPKNRLKIWTFKVSYPWQRLWERFLKIAFDNAINRKVDETYVTIHNNDNEKQRLIDLLQYFWFYYWGTKWETEDELVYLRDISKNFNQGQPSKTFPFISKSSNAFIIPIKEEYHTEFLPDSILNNESNLKFVESKPHHNSIRKCYVSRSPLCKEIKTWDNILFCMSASSSPGYKSVISTIATVENVISWIESEETFIRYCKGRTLFNEDELKSFRNEKLERRPTFDPTKNIYIINFLYNLALPTPKININKLNKLGILDWYLKWRTIQITKEQFDLFIKESKLNESYIVD